MDTVAPEMLHLGQAEEYINKDVKSLEKERVMLLFGFKQ